MNNHMSFWIKLKQNKHYMKFLTTIALLMLCCGISNAQLEKNIHKTFSVDSIHNLTLNFSGEVKIEKWAGNMILTETNVKLYDAGSPVLKYFIEKGRYDLALTKNGAEGELASIDQRLAPIRTKNGECYEIVTIKLLVPEEFEMSNDNLLIRKMPEPEINGDSTKIEAIDSLKTKVLKDSIKVDSLKSDTIKQEEIKMND